MVAVKTHSSWRQLAGRCIHRLGALHSALSSAVCGTPNAGSQRRWWLTTSVPAVKSTPKHFGVRLHMLAHALLLLQKRWGCSTCKCRRHACAQATQAAICFLHLRAHTDAPPLQLSISATTCAAIAAHAQWPLLTSFSSCGACSVAQTCQQCAVPCPTDKRPASCTATAGKGGNSSSKLSSSSASSAVSRRGSRQVACAQQVCVSNRQGWPAQQ